MKIVESVDSEGRKLRFAIRDDDDPEEAGEIGIPVGVPDLDQVNWNEVALELHNRLYDAHLFTRDELASSGNTLNNIILLTLKRRISLLYKE